MAELLLIPSKLIGSVLRETFGVVYLVGLSRLCFRWLQRQRCGEPDPGNGSDEDHWTTQKCTQPYRLLHTERYASPAFYKFTISHTKWKTRKLSRFLITRRERNWDSSVTSLNAMTRCQNDTDAGLIHLVPWYCWFGDSQWHPACLYSTNPVGFHLEDPAQLRVTLESQTG